MTNILNNKATIQEGNKESSLYLSENVYGQTKHFPPITKEWSNSIYSFDKNYEKTIPTADSTVNKLIRSYFTLSPLFGKRKSKRVQIRLKRLSLNRIQTSQPEMKHTNDKVTVTVYLYNKNKNFLISKMKKLYDTIFPTLNNRIVKLRKSKLSLLSINKIGSSLAMENLKNFPSLNKNETENNEINSMVSYKYDTKFEPTNNNNVQEDSSKFLHNLLIKTKKISLLKAKILSKKKKQENRTTKINRLSKTNRLNLLEKTNKLEVVSLKSVKLIKKIRRYKNFIIKLLKWNNDSFAQYESKYHNRFINKIYRKELLYAYYTKMLMFNNNKFKTWFLLGLKKVLSKVYNKKIEFNFVTLKYLHLNSDIFSESIAIKLKNRKNRLLNVLKKALVLVKLSKINLKNYTSFPCSRHGMPGTSSNKTKPATVNLNNDSDSLNSLLHNSFTNLTPKDNHSSLFNGPAQTNSVQVNILDSIKHKSVFGVRLEAAGRLSKRLTASRSVFKLKYKGSLKDIESSNKGLSSVILRGNLKPNIQYTKISSKTRNGAFGLKGWVSGY